MSYQNSNYLSVFMIFFSYFLRPENIIKHEDFICIKNDNTILARLFGEINEQFLYPDTTTKLLDKNLNIDKNLKIDENMKIDIVNKETGGDIDLGININKHGDLYVKKTPLLSPYPPLLSPTDTVISFSHFLPRQELCPEKRFLIEPLLTKVIGR